MPCISPYLYGLFKRVYVGETVEELRLRYNNYQSKDHKYQKLESCMQQQLFQHFHSEGHHCYLEEISIRFTDKTDPSEPLKSENYWSSILKTMAPWGLIAKDSV